MALCASFGAPGKVAETKEVADLDTVFLRFENGVRLTVKPTKFRDDEVLVRVNIGDGLQDFPKDRQSHGWFSSALHRGRAQADRQRGLPSASWPPTSMVARFGVGEDAFRASRASTRTQRPADPDAGADGLSSRSRLVQRGLPAPAERRPKSVHDQMEGTDGGVMGRELSGLLHGGDRRFTFPGRDDISRARLADLQAQIVPAAWPTIPSRS